jgi:hypothetical protein
MLYVFSLAICFQLNQPHLLRSLPIADLQQATLATAHQLIVVQIWLFGISQY